MSITIGPINDDPIAVDDAATTMEDTAVIVQVLANDTDIDGGPLTVTQVTQAAHGRTRIRPDGSLEYAPEPNYIGADSFTYIVSDGNGGTATATVRLDVTPDPNGPEPIAPAR